MNFLNKKRKHQEENAQDQENRDTSHISLKPEDVIQEKKRLKQNKQHKDNKAGEKIFIRLKDLVQIDKGFINLPKEIIEEAMAIKFNVIFEPKQDNGTNTYYYSCNYKECSYRIRIQENIEMIKQLNTASLISNFKMFDIGIPSVLSEGICSLTEYGEHKENHHKDPNNKPKFTKQGFYLFI